MSKPVRAATLLGRQDLTDTLAIFRLAPEDGVPDFEPGQFVTLGLPASGEGAPITWRAYSVASAPSTKEHLELYVRHALEPVAGRFTTELWKLAPGDRLLHRGITGPFTIEWRRPDGGADLRRLLLVASGTGIAPFVSYAVELSRRAAPRELVVVHGASHAEELAYADLFTRLERETAGAAEGAFRLRYLPTVSRPGDPRNAAWRGAVGRAESLLAAGSDGVAPIERALGVALSPEAFFCHACGPEGAVAAARASLELRGFRTFRDRHPDGTFDLKIESYG